MGFIIMETQTQCPNCKYIFTVEDYSFGDCPNCHETEYYWDNDWSEENDEYYWEGFIWNEK